MEISEADREWVSSHYPGLIFKSTADANELEGEFRFDAAWDEPRNCYLINPTLDPTDPVRIRDSYGIRIVLPREGSTPKIFETRGRISACAAKLGVPIVDLHTYETGEICPLGVFDKGEFDTVPQWIDGPILQFFYDQSYHERFGRWPRGQYSHGLLGVIENYHDVLSRDNSDSGELSVRCIELTRVASGPVADRVRSLLADKRRVQGHQSCLCGSGQKLRSCHGTFFRGLWSLHEHIWNEQGTLPTGSKNQILEKKR